MWFDSEGSERVDTVNFLFLRDFSDQDDYIICIIFNWRKFFGNRRSELALFVQSRINKLQILQHQK